MKHWVSTICLVCLGLLGLLGFVHCGSVNVADLNADSFSNLEDFDNVDNTSRLGLFSDPKIVFPKNDEE